VGNIDLRPSVDVYNNARIKLASVGCSARMPTNVREINPVTDFPDFRGIDTTLINRAEI
jgi:hypothetical protein